MHNLVLLIQDQADVQNLSSAADWIKAHGIKTVWGLCSPAVVVSTESATEELDKEIYQLDLLKQAAIDREDYDAARERKLEKEGKILDRAANIANAYKNLPKDEQDNRSRALFRPFGEAMQAAGVSLKVQRTAEHFETGNWLNLLSQYLMSWPEQMPHGSYAVTWARALTAFGVKQESSLADLMIRPKGPTPDLVPVKPISKKAPLDEHKNYTGEELEKLPFFTLRSLAKRMDAWTEKQPNTETIKRILSAQTLRARA